MGSRNVECRKFIPNIFNKSKCSHCFRQREEHSSAALESNRVSRKVSKCGYLFVAPDWDFTNPLYRTKRWQRRWFVLYDDGELTYSVDEHPETIPQASIDMTKVLEVKLAEDITGHINSIAVITADRSTYVKGTCAEEAKWWLNVLCQYPKSKGRHKRNITFPGGTVSSVSNQTQQQNNRNRHNTSYHPEIISNPTPTVIDELDSWQIDENNKNISNENNNVHTPKGNRVLINQPASSKSPPTRDKLYPEGKAQSRIRNRNRNISSINGQQQQQQQQPQNKESNNETTPADTVHLIIDDEKQKDVTNAIISVNQNRWSPSSASTPSPPSTPTIIPLPQQQPSLTTTPPSTTSTCTESIVDEKPTRDLDCNNSIPKVRPQTLALASSNAPAIVSAIIKKSSESILGIIDGDRSRKEKNSSHKHNERGDPDGGCNVDDVPINYLLNKKSELRVNLPTEDVVLNSKKGWLMQQDTRTAEWKKHWFVLRGAALYYYRDPIAEERGVLDGVLDVNNITSISELHIPQYCGFQLKIWDNRRIILSSASTNIRKNWMNILKSAAGLNKTLKEKSDEKIGVEEDTAEKLVDKENNFHHNKKLSPVTPLTPKSIGFSSDEEYRTASEGGRRDSVDWGSPISTSPPIPLTIVTQTKDNRKWSKSATNSRLHHHSANLTSRRSRSSPPISRRSTIDSLGSDDMIMIQPVQEEELSEPDLKLRMVTAEEELTLLKEEANERECQVTNLLSTLEKTEFDLKKRIKELEIIRDNLAMQLTQSKNESQELVDRLTMELNENQKAVRNLEDKLSRGIEENVSLYKKLRDFENSSPSVSSNVSGSLTRLKMKSRVDSLSDLTNFHEIDPYSLERDTLADEYAELKMRFEKAVNEIKLMKKELRDTQYQFDSLDIQHSALKQDYERRKMEDESQLNMMAARIKDLTLKYAAAEKQVRNLKAKLAKSTEKRRSLSLKGRETLSLPKEFEEKVTALENKIDAIENNYDGENKIRRKSLDNSAISAEPIQVLLRLNTLQKRVESNSSPKQTSNHMMERLKSLEGVVIATRDRIDQGLHQIQNLRMSSHRQRRSVSPIADKKDTLKFVEKCLLDAGKLLKDSCDKCIIGDGQHTVLLPESNPIRLALIQLESQLKNKLNDLLRQRRVLRERNELTTHKDLELLAERVAFESVCFGRIRDAMARKETSEQFCERQTRVEIAETSQLLSLLKSKLSGQCGVKPNGSLDILATVLARRLILTVNQTGQHRIPAHSPVSVKIMEDLLRQQNEINLIAMRYKNNALDNLALGLAAETLTYISANDTVQGAIQDAWRQAQETVNSELVQNEIANVMMRNAERYENALAPAFGYTITNQERISFESFSDSVQDVLRKEMDAVIEQLTQKYDECLIKMKNGQWRIHLEEERKSSEGRQLLAEFADIIAHKALIDARVNILKGETPSIISKDLLPSKENNNNYLSIMSLQKYENLFIELAEDLDVTNPDDIIAEADFNFMFKFFANDFTKTKSEINEATNSLTKLENSITNLESAMTTPKQGVVTATLTTIDTSDRPNICKKFQHLTSRIETIKSTISQQYCENCIKLEKHMVDLQNHHKTQISDLQKVHAENYEGITRDLEEKRQFIDILQTEKMKLFDELTKAKSNIDIIETELTTTVNKCEFFESETDKLKTETRDLCECLEEERENSKHYLETINGMRLQSDYYTQGYQELESKYNKVSQLLELEKERVRKLEHRVQFFEQEHQEQIQQLQDNFKQHIEFNESDENHAASEENLRERYQAEIEYLRTLCEKGLAAMEASHRRIISELAEKHRLEIEELLAEKEQALAEETQATLAALDAMRKAHQNEVQREVARFKKEFLKQFKLNGDSVAGGPREKDQELEDVRHEILSLSEKYSLKCLEAASLEEKLKMVTQQVKQSQQFIQQLESRNKQLRAHIMSDDLEFSSSAINSLAQSKESTPAPTSCDVHGNIVVDSVTSPDQIIEKKKEIQPKLSLIKEINFPTTYTPVYKSSSLLTSYSCNSSSQILAKNPSMTLGTSLKYMTSRPNPADTLARHNTDGLPTIGYQNCSSPPLNEKLDVEQSTNFELDI